MSAPTWTTLLAAVRSWSQDKDTVNPLFSDAELLAEFNAQYIAWKGQADDRVAFLTHQALIDNSNPIAIGTRIKVTLAANVRRFLRFYIVPGITSSAWTSELEIAEPWEVQALQSDDNVQGTPSMISALRQQTGIAANVGKWQLEFWRIPDALFYLAAQAIVEPAVITSGSDVPDVSDVEAYGLAWSAASVCAFLNGRSPDYVAELKARVPDHMQAALANMRKATSPRPRPAEEPA